MYKEIQVGRLYEKIIEQIEENILNTNLRPGDKLPSERELCEQFGVSRTAIREAMKALTQKGLIEVQPGRGTFITDSTSNAVRSSLNWMVKLGLEEGTRSLVEVRNILEPEIAALAASRSGPEHVQTMQKSVEAMDASLDDPAAFIDADMDFHLALAEATHNPLILLLLEPLVDALRELRTQISKVEGGMQRAQEHHTHILQAIIERSPDEARQAMQLHLEQVYTDSEVSLDLTQ